MLMTTIFYHVDNFCNDLEKSALSETTQKQVGRKPFMRRSEIVTICLFFHHSKVRTCKDYYKIYIKGIYKSAFGK